MTEVERVILCRVCARRIADLLVDGRVHVVGKDGVPVRLRSGEMEVTCNNRMYGGTKANGSARVWHCRTVNLVCAPVPVVA